MVKEGVLYPFSGMWMSAAILIPIGSYLMYKARKDAQPFQSDRIFQLWSGIKAFISSKASAKTN
jgi:lipopolysaccharide export system permease protein